MDLGAFVLSKPLSLRCQPAVGVGWEGVCVRRQLDCDTGAHSFPFSFKSASLQFSRTEEGKLIMSKETS